MNYIEVKTLETKPAFLILLMGVDARHARARAFVHVYVCLCVCACERYHTSYTDKYTALYENDILQILTYYSYYF